MNQTTISIVSLMALFMVTGWGSGETNSTGSSIKHATNFYGTLQTWDNPDNIIKIENISIDNLFKKIPMFVKPTEASKKGTDSSTLTDAEKAAQATQKAAQEAQDAAQKEPNNKELQAIAQVTEKAAQAAQKAASSSLKKSKPEQAITKNTEYILENDPRTSNIETKIDLSEVSELQIPFPYEQWVYQQDKDHRKYAYMQIDVLSKDENQTKISYLLEREKKIYCDRSSDAGPIEQEVPLQAIKKLTIEGFKDRELEKIKNKQEQAKSAKKQS